MNDYDDERLHRLLRGAMPPPSHLTRDLWPDMLRRLDVQTIHVAWSDWVLTAVALTSFVFFPGLVTVVLFLM